MATVSRSVLQLRKLRDAILEKVELPSGQKLKSAKIGVEQGGLSVSDAPFARIWIIQTRRERNSNTKKMDVIIAIATDIQDAIDNSVELGIEAAALIEEQVIDILQTTVGLSGDFYASDFDADKIARNEYKLPLQVVTMSCSILV